LFTTERPACERFYQGRGIDFRTGEVELSPTEIFLCGGHGMTGIRINEKGESSVPGLYAAGDTSLCVRGHLSGAFVYGEVAAEYGTGRASLTNHGDLDISQVDEFQKDKTAKLNQSNGRVPIEELEYKIRRIITDYLTPPKNEYKMDRALWWMNRFKEEFTHIPRSKTIHDLFKAYEVENIIQCAELNALASKERKESRWGFWHQRMDYPNKDDINWRKHIILAKDSNSNEINVTHKEVIH